MSFETGILESVPAIESAPAVPSFLKEMCTVSRSGLKEKLLKQASLEAFLVGGAIVLAGFGAQAAYRAVANAYIHPRRVRALIANGRFEAAVDYCIEHGLSRTERFARELVDEEQRNMEAQAQAAQTTAADTAAAQPSV